MVHKLGEGTEKKELKQDKAAGIEGHEKQRERVSMRQKLGEKKAEIAARDGKSLEAGKVNAPKRIGVDD